MITTNRKVWLALGTAIAAIGIGTPLVLRADDAARKKSAAEERAFAEEDRLVDRAEAYYEKIQKNPRDARLKIEASDAYLTAGRAVLAGPDSHNRISYKLAWDCFREALKYNPSNVEASEEKKRVEEIWRQRGYPPLK